MQAGELNPLPSSVAAKKVVEQLRTQGCAIIESAIDPTQLDGVRRDFHDRLSAAHTGHEDFAGHRTIRIGGLLAKSTHVQALLLHPVVIAAVDTVLLPHCVRYRLHYSGLIQLEPGERAQVLHRDTGIFPIANPAPPLTVATMWAMSDFTIENGATQLVPGSHLWADDRQPKRGEVVSAEMRAGSVLIYVGNLLHGGGENNSQDSRCGLALHYALGWLRQEENQYLSVPRPVAETLPVAVQELLGYALGGPNLGFADRIDPGKWLQDDRDPTRTELTPTVLRDRAAALNRFHVSESKPGPNRYYEIDDE
ncbi:MAG: phytanoyl-CoA dioxygenase family protein [Pseudomonadota bacterium]